MRGAFIRIMCGRATLVVSTKEIREVFDVDEVPELPPRYNIAPSQPMLVMRTPKVLELMTWGPKFINAKLEHATTKPRNRCLVVVDGFYEWRHGDRQPFYFRRHDRKPFAVAGVTRTTEAACAVVTCPAGEGMVDLHSRMPLVLHRDAWAAWLAGEKPDPAAALEGFDRYAVSRHVNSPKNDDPMCLASIAGGA